MSLNRTLVSFLMSSLLFMLGAQKQPTFTSADILQQLHKLNTAGSVLYIAAHPDDENTRLLAYLASEKKFRTGYLSITRGDGGQNLIGKEQGEALGLIRTQELLAARRVDGAEQFFTRAKDFGYSKNPEETFQFWNKDSILSDVVLVIRKFRPDVVICRFPTTGEGGHGHHTASAILANEAFEAAADPAKFAWQLKLYPAWKTRTIVWNTFNFGSTNTTSADQLKTDVGLYNVFTGKSYGEVAATSRSMHKSQGFGSAAQRGSNIEYFKFLKGDSVKKDLFENMKSLSQVLPDNPLQDCIKQYDAAHPEKSIPALTSLFKMINALQGENNSVFKKEKLNQIETLVMACAGIWAESAAADYIALPGSETQLTTQVIARNNYPVKLLKVHYPGLQDTLTNLSLKVNSMYTFKRRIKLDDTLPYSSPYWLKQEHTAGLYQVKDARLIGKPENDALLKVVFDLEIDGFEYNLVRDVIFKSTDPVKGEIYRPLEILPKATIALPEKVLVFNSEAPRKVRFNVKANANGVSGTFQLKLSEGWKATIASPSFTILNKGEEVIIDATIIPAKNASAGKLEAFVTIDGKNYDQAIRRIEYDHIPYQFILSDAEAKLVYIDLKTDGTNIAYIPGAGDEVRECLEQVGYNVTLLTDEMLAHNDLTKYDAIVTGIRAYNTNDQLQLHHNRLMDYVKKGGNLVVQYNTNSRAGPLQAKIGPYPFTISRDRVTNENAAVRIPDPAHVALNKPNKISEADFEGWVQERGIYFATETDKNYEKILSMNDPHEKPSEGSVIIARYGKGNFVYTGLVFFRLLPAGVPGGYRLLANFLSLPKH
jgi:LmbE family N-acetylglucosaminyl deacetylase